MDFWLLTAPNLSWDNISWNVEVVWDEILLATFLRWFFKLVHFLIFESSSFLEYLTKLGKKTLEVCHVLNFFLQVLSEVDHLPTFTLVFKPLLWCRTVQCRFFRPVGTIVTVFWFERACAVIFHELFLYTSKCRFDYLLVMDPPFFKLFLSLDVLDLCHRKKFTFLHRIVNLVEKIGRLGGLLLIARE